MPPYRVGIVGLSWIAADAAAPASHPVLGTATPYSHAAAFAAIPQVEVVAGCDIVPAACEAFAERWQEKWPCVRTYLDYREMLEKERIDLLAVATPDHVHAEVVLAAAAAGVRAIFCEKPLATSLEDADAMIAAVRKQGIAINVNHTRRWYGPYVAAREVIRSGRIGPLTQITIHFGGPRAMLFRNHSHFLDLFSYFAEATPEWVVAELEAGYADYGMAYAGDGGRDPAKEPAVNAYIAYPNGVRGFLGGMKHSFQDVSVDLIGATGRIHVDDSRAMLIYSADGGTAEQQIVPKATVSGMQAAVLDLIHSLETGDPPQSPPEEARKAVALALAILESQAKGNVPVRVR